MNGAPSFENNRWYCLEIRMTMNTASTSQDGYLQGWIDNVQHYEYPNINLDETIPNNIRGFLLSGYWNCQQRDCSGPEDTHPLMYRWHDNFVVSTERIGCLSTQRVPPPSTPKNLQANAISQSQINLTWTASTDTESGISHYIIYRNNVNVATSPTNSYSDSGLNPGITYSYQVSAVNGVNLESGKSNTATKTTPDIVCGNGIIETGEECDDGNILNGDGCSSVCTVEPVSRLGDINDDGVVDIQDIILIENEFGKTFGFNPRADARKDNLIDLFDVMVVVINWGNRY